MWILISRKTDVAAWIYEMNKLNTKITCETFSANALASMETAQVRESHNKVQKLLPCCENIWSEKNVHGNLI